MNLVDKRLDKATALRLLWVKRYRVIQCWCRSMSPIPRKRPNRGHVANDEKGQEETHALQQKRSLFDHLVGEREHVVRDFNSEVLCGLEVDDELELG